MDFKKFFLSWNIGKVILTWDVNKAIFDSFAGKAFILLTILSIILSVPFVDKLDSINLFMYSIAVLSFIIGYILNLVFIPDVIRNFTRYEYIEYIFFRNEKKQLSIITEFTFINNININDLPIYKNPTENFSKIEDITSMSEISKDNLYQLSQIKYDYLNQEDKLFRFFITISLVTFFVSLYYLSIEKIIQYLF